MVAFVDIGLVRQQLQQHRPIVVVHEDVARAAVALVVRDGSQGAEVLLIQRAERASDPWSGHMALPGGRQEPGDGDLYATAARETNEEVGLDLGTHGEWIGRLDELQAVGRGKVLPLVITPIACELRSAVSLRLNRTEVRDAVWIPLTTLREPGVQGHYMYELDGVISRHPAYVHGRYTIWGLTYRILTNLLSLVDR